MIIRPAWPACATASQGLRKLVTVEVGVRISGSNWTSIKAGRPACMARSNAAANSLQANLSRCIRRGAASSKQQAPDSGDSCQAGQRRTKSYWAGQNTNRTTVGHDLGTTIEKSIQHRCRNLLSLRWPCKGHSLYRGSTGHRHNSGPSKAKGQTAISSQCFA